MKLANKDLGNAEVASDALLNVQNLEVCYRTKTTLMKAFGDVIFRGKQ